MPVSAEKFLIVNADDFGITEGATDAIIACHLSGAVTSTTLMSTMPAAGYAARLAMQNPALAVGLHFNLTLGQPRAGALRSTLVDVGGNFWTRRGLAIRAICGRLRTSDVHDELEAQYAAMRSLGLHPTHIDSHQHVHAIPGIFSVVAAFAAARNLPIRMPWGWAGVAHRKRFSRLLKERVLRAALRYLDSKRPVGVATNDGFCSVFDLGIRPDQLSVDSYRALLAPYRAGVVELMVHPAYVDDELIGKTAISATSDVEQKLLMGSSFTTMVKELGFRLATFAAVADRKH